MTRPEPGTSQVKKHKKRFKIKILLFVLLILVCFIEPAQWEIRTSRFQAALFSQISEKFGFEVKEGRSSDIRFPAYGPYDIRLGYVRIPEWAGQLGKKGFKITDQAEWSDDMIHYTDWGLFPIYDEKAQAGIKIVDENGQAVLQTAFPQRIYPNFESIPPIVVKSLLYIENRKLLDSSSPYQNPAVEWERLSKALVDAFIHIFDPAQRVPGGSTLATQMEKFRHSPEGLTDSMKEKLRQILSASLRSYKYGEKTMAARKKIALDYINSIPLSAAIGFGEVNGLGDGLWAWYGKDFDTINRQLFDVEKKGLTGQQLNEAGASLKCALSLFLAQRRPTDYLSKNKTFLEDLTNSYLRLLAKDGLISTRIRDAALATRLEFNKEATLNYPLQRAQRKAANLLRSRLMSDLKVNSFYDLDRVDLAAESTIDMEIQKKITRSLEALKDASFVEQNGLKAQYLLETGDPSKILYSFSLFEKTPEGNALRVQTNNFEGPFNIDEQMKLDLGSSAKLRTLVHYLEIVAELHGRYAGLSLSELAELSQKETDHLTSWAIDYLINSKDRNLTDMLEAAMERKYSASPYEQFMTGGGLHTFANFNKDDNSKILTVRQALSNSVNLVFIRIMRDISYYHIYQRYSLSPHSLDQLSSIEKKRLLTLFVDREGISFIKRFYQTYKHKTPEAITELMLAKTHSVPQRLAMIYRFLDPDPSIDGFAKILSQHLPGSNLKEPFIDKIYDQYDPEKFILADIGYIARIHPLELWVAKYLQKNPEASLSDIVAKSADVRQEVYHWLFKTKNPYKQNKRIRIIIELEAFEDIFKAWKKMGYPFDYIVPSYASAIGSSGDRPGALAELIGIIQNNGVRLPIVRFKSLLFGKDTPYETRLDLGPATGQLVLDPEVAKTAKLALIHVVEEGTARRIKGAMSKPDGTIIPIGGKTGTGDHRYKTFGPGGVLTGSTVMNRAAIFIFFIDDRYFGTMTAYVPGKDAKDYSFTSALPVQILKMVTPDLAPFITSQKSISPEK